jgi:DNA-binding CsgD family transcriptional regulator
VLKLLAVSKSNKEISTILGISTRTVETYRFRVTRKIDASTLVDLVHYAIRHEIVKLT